MGEACSTYGGVERRIQGFVGKPEGKRPRRRPRIFRKWNVGAWTGLILLRIETGGRHL